jgi:hypothetical protein
MLGLLLAACAALLGSTAEAADKSKRSRESLFSKAL